MKRTGELVGKYTVDPTERFFSSQLARQRAKLGIRNSGLLYLDDFGGCRLASCLLSLVVYPRNHHKTGESTYTVRTATVVDSQYSEEWCV